MSSILQGLGSNRVSHMERNQNVAPKEEKNKEGRPAGAAPPNRDSYVPSNEAVMIMSQEPEEVEDTLFDELIEEGTSVDVADVDVDGDEFDVDGDEIDVDGDEVDVDEEELEVEEETVKTYNSITVAADSSDRTHGYMSSLSSDDLAMLEIAYMGFSTSSYESSSSLFDYLGDSSSSSDWWSNDTSTYDSILEALAAYSSSSTTETEEEVDEVEETEDSVEEVEETEETEETLLDELVDEEESDATSDQEETEEN